MPSLRQSSAAAKRYRQSRQIIPWSPNLEIVRKHRPYIPWETDVGTYSSLGKELYFYPTTGQSTTGAITAEGVMVVGAIAIAIIGIYFWITKTPKLPEPQ